MMKVSFYVDLYDDQSLNRSNLKTHGLFATTNPGAKFENTKRVRIQVDLPNHFFSEQSDTDAFIESVDIEDASA